MNDWSGPLRLVLELFESKKLKKSLFNSLER